MNRKKILLISTAILLLITLVPLAVNRIYSAMLDKTYTNLSNSSGKGYKLIKVPIKGKLEYQQNELFGDNEGYIYMDTVTHNFKLATVAYAGFDDADLTTYFTFNTQGSIILTERYIPRQTEDGGYRLDKETLNSKGKVIQVIKDAEINPGKRSPNCILLKGDLSTFPKWKERSSLVYIRHFSKREFNLSALNPFWLGGINNDKPRYPWHGDAYCDFMFMGKILKLKIPFAYDSLILNTSEYYAELQYYSLPRKYVQTLPIKFIRFNDAVYIVTAQ